MRREGERWAAQPHSFFWDSFSRPPLISQPISRAVGLGTTYALAGGLMLICGLTLMGLQRPICRLIAAKTAWVLSFATVIQRLLSSIKLNAS
jgi:hypothetical protein